MQTIASRTTRYASRAMPHGSRFAELLAGLAFAAAIAFGLSARSFQADTAVMNGR